MHCHEALWSPKGCDLSQISYYPESKLWLFEILNTGFREFPFLDSLGEWRASFGLYIVKAVRGKPHYAAHHPLVNGKALYIPALP
jgi:hypothetical protein